MSKRKMNKYRVSVVQIVELEKEVEVWLPALHIKCEDIKRAAIKAAMEKDYDKHESGWAPVDEGAKTCRQILREMPLDKHVMVDFISELVDSKYETVKDDKLSKTEEELDEEVEDAIREEEENAETDEEREEREERESEERDRQEHEEHVAKSRREHDANKNSWNWEPKSDDELLEDEYEARSNCDGEEIMRRRERDERANRARRYDDCE